MSNNSNGDSSMDGGVKQLCVLFCCSVQCVFFMYKTRRGQCCLPRFALTLVVGPTPIIRLVADTLQSLPINLQGYPGYKEIQIANKDILLNINLGPREYTLRPENPPEMLGVRFGIDSNYMSGGHPHYSSPTPRCGKWRLGV